MKKVLFVGDIKNWAMHHIYLYMEKELKKHFKIKYVSFKEFKCFKEIYGASGFGVASTLKV
jgi:hypothetical protein